MANVKKIQVGSTKYNVRDSRIDGTIGASDRPIYVNGGTPTQVTTVNGKYVEGYISSGKESFLTIHPEGDGIIIPYLFNDLAYLFRQGGSATIYSTTSNDLTADTLTVKTLWKSTESELQNLFDCAPTYLSLGNDNAAEMNADGLIIDITLPSLFKSTSRFYIDFGTSSWGFSHIDILVKNTANETAYVSKVSGADTNGRISYFCKLTHTSGNSVTGFNKMRIHLYDRTNTNGVRIAQIGVINYNSAGPCKTFMARGEDDAVYRSISPATNDTYALGTSSKKWSDVYAVDGNFSGILTVPTAAAGTSTTQAASCEFVQNIVGDIETLLAAL